MIIGITGGIGSGKSTIARELANRGYACYDCDREAKRIIAENSDVQKHITDLLGDNAFADGRYNTAYVAQRVFVEPELLQSLNAIVHPAVFADLQRFRNLHRTDEPLFVESAILFESGLNRLCDKAIVIEAPVDVRVQRVIARDYNGLATPENIKNVQARIAAQKTNVGQWPSALIIRNDGTTTIAELADSILSKLQ